MKYALALLAGVGFVCACAPAQAQSGSQLYFNHCAACHGEDGEGTGPVAAVMQVTVPNLRTLAQRSGGVFPADAVKAYIDGRSVPASHGMRQMPVWGDVFAGGEQGRAAENRARERIDAIVQFIAELQYR